jgi:hypothetical protein
MEFLNKFSVNMMQSYHSYQFFGQEQRGIVSLLAVENAVPFVLK